MSKVLNSSTCQVRLSVAAPYSAAARARLPPARATAGAAGPAASASYDLETVARIQDIAGFLPVGLGRPQVQGRNAHHPALVLQVRFPEAHQVHPQSGARRVRFSLSKPLDRYTARAPVRLPLGAGPGGRPARRCGAEWECAPPPRHRHRSQVVSLCWYRPGVARPAAEHVVDRVAQVCSVPRSKLGVSSSRSLVDRLTSCALRISSRNGRLECANPRPRCRGCSPQMVGPQAHEGVGPHLHAQLRHRAPGACRLRSPS